MNKQSEKKGGLAGEQEVRDQKNKEIYKMPLIWQEMCSYQLHFSKEATEESCVTPRGTTAPAHT